MYKEIYDHVRVFHSERNEKNQAENETKKLLVTEMKNPKSGSKCESEV